MISHLSITNYAIIEQIDLDFNKGFTVITGETGAGKSILLGAIALILGNRVDTSVLNNKDKKCIIEGSFVFNEMRFKSFFADNDIDFEEETIIRREISKTGKSRAFINDTPVNLSVLKDLSGQLIDVHSQHQTLKLQNNQFQIDVIDSFAKLGSEVDKFQIQFRTYKKLQKELADLINKEANEKADVEYIKFQVNEIEELNLQINEQEGLQEKLAIITNAETIKTTMDKATGLLSVSDQNIITNLKDVVSSFNDIVEYGKNYEEQHQRLNSLLIELEDLAADIENSNNHFEFDAENAQYLSERLSIIFGLEQKHNLTTSDELLELLEDLKSQLNAIDSVDEEIEQLKIHLNKEKKSITSLAQKISNKRIKVIPQIEKIIIAHLADLGMPESSFIVKQAVLSEVNENGIDEIKFLFSANKGFQVKELEKTASGGELSRLMLSIKSILATSTNVSAIIFDEIDTGVSGDIADKMAGIMKDMSKNIQIIAITHLPQVAAKGDQHIKIYKETNATKTATYLKELSNEDRVDEIAKMLSGKDTSAIAKENAKILLG